MTLFIDSREKGLPLATYLYNTLGEKVRFKTLDGGDFVIPVENGSTDGTNIIIERSTITDLLGKVKTNRLSDQLYKMEQLSDNIHILIEEPYKLKFTKWNQYAAISLIAGLSLKYKVFISSSIIWSSSYIMYLHKKFGEERDLTTTEYKTRHKPRKDMTPTETASYMLQGIEGVGEVTAERVLEQASISKMALMDFNQLRELFKNATVGDRVYQALNAKNIYKENVIEECPTTK